MEVILPKEKEEVENKVEIDDGEFGPDSDPSSFDDDIIIPAEKKEETKDPAETGKTETEDPDGEAKPPEGTEDPDNKPDTETDPKTDELHYLEKLFQDNGLGKQFSNPEDALKRIPQMNQHIDNLTKKLNEAALENQKLKNPTKPPEEVQEEFDAEQLKALDKAGYVKGDKLEKMEAELAELKQVTFMRTESGSLEPYPELKSVQTAMALGSKAPTGLNKPWDAFTAEINSSEGLSNMQFTDLMQYVYPKFRDKLGYKDAAPDTPEPKVDPISNKRKEEATTTGSNSGGEKGGKPNFAKMSVEQIEDYHLSKGTLVE